MTSPAQVTVHGRELTVTINIPLPNVKLPRLGGKFPPKLTIGSLPNPVLYALNKIGKGLAYILKVVEKLVNLIPDASVRLVIKVAGTTILDQNVSTEELKTIIPTI